MKNPAARSIVLGILIGGSAAGCSVLRPPPRPADRPVLTAESSAAKVLARTLRDAGLRQFIATNTGKAPAQWPPAEWDFETLTWSAFYLHPALEVSRAQWAAARAAAAAAEMRPNPTFTFTPGYNSSVGSPTPWFPAVNIDTLLLTNGKRARAAEIERINSEASRLEVLASAWRVRSDLRRAITEAAGATRRSALLQSLAQGQREIVSLLDERRAAGGTSAIEVSSARTAHLRAESAAAEARAQTEVSRVSLARALGVSIRALDDVRPESITIPTQSAAPSRDELSALVRESLRSRSDILAAVARYRAAELGLEQEVARRLPDFHIGPGYQYDMGENKWTVALSFELPVFNRNEGPVAVAEARRVESAAQLAAIQAEVVGTIESAAAALGVAAENLQRTAQQESELTRQADRAAARRVAGSADRLEVLAAAADAANAALASLEARQALALASGAFADAIQVPIPDLEAAALAAQAKQKSNE